MQMWIYVDQAHCGVGFSSRVRSKSHHELAHSSPRSKPMKGPVREELESPVKRLGYILKLPTFQKSHLSLNA